MASPTCLRRIANDHMGPDPEQSAGRRQLRGSAASARTRVSQALASSDTERAPVPRDRGGPSHRGFSCRVSPRPFIALATADEPPDGRQWRIASSLLVMPDTHWPSHWRCAPGVFAARRSVATACPPHLQCLEVPSIRGAVSPWQTADTASVAELPSGCAHAAARRCGGGTSRMVSAPEWSMRVVAVRGASPDRM